MQETNTTKQNNKLVSFFHVECIIIMTGLKLRRIKKKKI